MRKKLTSIIHREIHQNESVPILQKFIKELYDNKILRIDRSDEWIAKKLIKDRYPLEKLCDEIGYDNIYSALKDVMAIILEDDLCIKNKCLGSENLPKGVYRGGISAGFSCRWIIDGKPVSINSKFWTAQEAIKIKNEVDKRLADGEDFYKIQKEIKLNNK